MALSTIATFLMMKGSGSNYEKLVDITGYPDLGGEPNMLPANDLSHDEELQILGIRKAEPMSFPCNYDLEDLQKLKTIEQANEEKDFAVYFGGTKALDGTLTPTGANGIFKFSGKLAVYATGHGVDEVRGMTVTIARATPVVVSAPSGS